MNLYALYDGNNNYGLPVLTFAGFYAPQTPLKH
jgi:hypothetical protein